MKQYKAWELLPEEKVYLKSEADKVIAELKAQKAQAEDDCAYWKMREGQAVNAIFEAEEACKYGEKLERHQKYKRCLAMAWWCGSRAYIHEHGSEYDEDLVAWFGKWNKRWLELAEKFKPNKEAK